MTFTWHDADSDQERTLTVDGTRPIWLRFSMSFLINGAGFLFLLHVLPIQVAGQANAIGVVFRAVGMIYLVDLDDTVGNVMTLTDLSTTSNEPRGHGTGFLSTFRRLREKLTNDEEQSPDEATSLLT